MIARRRRFQHPTRRRIRAAQGCVRQLGFADQQRTSFFFRRDDHAFDRLGRTGIDHAGRPASWRVPPKGGKIAGTRACYHRCFAFSLCLPISTWPERIW